MLLPTQAPVAECEIMETASSRRRRDVARAGERGKRRAIRLRFVVIGREGVVIDAARRGKREKRARMELRKDRRARFMFREKGAGPACWDVVRLIRLRFHVSGHDVWRDAAGEAFDFRKFSREANEISERCLRIDQTLRRIRFITLDIDA